jgi:SAM-dependent methyltransferase
LRTSDSSSAAARALCRRRADCRLCGSRNLALVLALTPTPPANAFVSASDLASPQLVFPLDVFLCESCAHVQLLDVVDPKLLFENYVYVSGTSPAFVRHFENYAAAVTKRLHLQDNALVVDIGSNDGTLLKAFKTGGFTVLGVDPARDIATRTTMEGIETLPEFFTPALAKWIRAERGPAAVITANNVFAHADDLAGILDGVRSLLAPDGVFVFEVSYLVDVYEKTLFDTIYHEHLAYHSVQPLRGFFSAHGLELFAVERVATHGGSIRGFSKLTNGPWRDDGSVQTLIQLEEQLRLDHADTFRGFAARIKSLGNQLKTLLEGLRAKGKHIAGFGAPAKATTLMYHFGLGSSLIDFIVDDSPWKQGLFSPGIHIPVVASNAIYERSPDCVLILAWNFADTIITKHADFLRRGGCFIIPLPNVEIRSL